MTPADLIYAAELHELEALRPSILARILNRWGA